MTGVLIAGSGGQGILFLGKLLANAAMNEGKNVTWFPSYGAEMRGGTATCTVIISGEPIGSPVIHSPEVLVAMNSASREKFEGRVKEGGLLLFDSSLAGGLPIRRDIRVMNVPASEIAASLGDARAANMVLLGALISEGLIGEKSALGALDELTTERRKSGIDINKKAVRRGRSAYKKS